MGGPGSNPTIGKIFQKNVFYGIRTHDYLRLRKLRVGTLLKAIFSFWILDYNFEIMGVEPWSFLDLKVLDSNQVVDSIFLSETEFFAPDLLDYFYSMKDGLLKDVSEDKDTCIQRLFCEFLSHEDPYVQNMASKW